ncbi:hypothetical protein [Lactococcus cremoris]|uniref:hypothetical protein n=1 Tax=Lactococcus lactis subsp. cremoris TaxID=1359 RepID=UPI0005824167|nr:hypothetical protein [Lactococcus cremoris]KGH32461.1 hypothetical protein JL36_13325 [Lactococcus cremoris]
MTDPAIMAGLQKNVVNPRMTNSKITGLRGSEALSYVREKQELIQNEGNMLKTLNSDNQNP